jgi:hypothetical protein
MNNDSDLHKRDKARPPYEARSAHDYTVDRMRPMLAAGIGPAGIGGTGAPVRGGPLAYKRTPPSMRWALSSARRLAESGERV